MKLLMKRACILLVMCLLASINVYAARGVKVAPVSPVGKEVKGDTWLFVIGIDTYIEWPRLKTAVNDARAVRDVLLSRYHFNKENLIELYDEQATRANIFKELRFLTRKLGSEDSLLIFYAGHGHLDSLTKEGSWIPVESGTKDVSAWISNHDIKNYLRVDAIKAKHVLLISDSCFSGDFFRGHRGKLPEVTDQIVKKAYKLTSRQAISSGGLEPVSDAGFGNNSVFSHFLIKALRENSKPFLVPSDFYREVKAGVAENAEQFPQFGSLKGTGGQQGGEMVLFLKQDAKLDALSAEATERQKELNRLQQMEVFAEETARKEAKEIARREKELSVLDTKIEAMRKRLGSTATQADDSLDTMLAMVRQKEAQERRLEKLRRQKEEEERKRQEEIARLKRERENEIIAILKPAVEKYKEIVASKYGKELKSEAWKSLTSKCPPGWNVGVEEGDAYALLIKPSSRDYYKMVELTSSPSDAQIYLDGKDLGKATPYLLKMTTGKHELKLKKGRLFHRSNIIVDTNQRSIHISDFRIAQEKALKLNGKNGFAKIFVDSKEITDEVTFEFWMKWTIPPERGHRWAVLVAEENYGESAIRIQHRGHQKNRGIEFSDNSVYLFSKTVPSNNEWLFISAIFKKDVKKLYINGIFEGKARANIRGKPMNVFLLGKGRSNYFTGYIDEFRIWNRALTEEEIKRRMHTVLEGDETGLVAYYNFEYHDKDGKLENLAPMLGSGILQGTAKLDAAGTPVSD